MTVELAPKVKDELDRLTAEGSILSVQDFVRRAVDNELLRWREANAARGPPEPAALVVPLAPRKRS